MDAQVNLFLLQGAVILMLRAKTSIPYHPKNGHQIASFNSAFYKNDGNIYKVLPSHLCTHEFVGSQQVFN